MVLRPDEPPLFYFPEGRWTHQSETIAVVAQLSNIRSLLWGVLALLVVIALLLFIRR